MVWVELDLLTKSADGIGVIVDAGICAAKIEPHVFQVCVAISRALQQIDCAAIVFAFQSFYSGGVEFGGRAFHFRGRIGRTAGRRKNRGRQQLIRIAERYIAERFIIRAARGGQLIHLYVEFALALEHSQLRLRNGERIRRGVFAVVARYLHRQRSVHGVIRGKFKMDLIVGIACRPDVDWIGAFRGGAHLRNSQGREARKSTLAEGTTK